VLLEGVTPALGFSDPVVAEAARLVRMTATHRVEPGDRAAAALADADLAVLASDPARYLDYAAGVRAEYRHVPDQAFALGRTAVLRDLLAHQPLFQTEIGQRRFEAAARTNVTVELRMLADGIRRPAPPR
jgi:predicted metal-dependent HD superfamily phosphohydrolase